MLVAGVAGRMMVFASERLTSPWQKASVICGTVEMGVEVAAGAVVAGADVEDEVLLLPVLVDVLLHAERPTNTAASAMAARKSRRERDPENGRCSGECNDTCDIIG